MKYSKKNHTHTDSVVLKGELLPVFPISGSVFFPNTIVPLHIFEPRYKQMLKDIQEGNNQFILTSFTKTGDIFNIGVLVELINVEELKDGRLNITVNCFSRINIIDFFRAYSKEDYAIGEGSRLEDEKIDESDMHWIDLRTNIYNEFKKHFEKITKKPFEIPESLIAETFSPEESVNTVCYFTEVGLEVKQDLLSTDSTMDRGKKILQIYQQLNTS